MAQNVPMDFTPEHGTYTWYRKRIIFLPVGLDTKENRGDGEANTKWMKPICGNYVNRSSIQYSLDFGRMFAALQSSTLE